MSCPPTSPGGPNSGEGGADDQGHRPEAPTRTSHLGQSLISPPPTANNAYLGQGEGWRAGQIQVILKPKSVMGRAGRRGQGGGCRGGPRVKEGLGNQIERALESAWSLLVTKEPAGASLWGWEL